MVSEAFLKKMEKRGLKFNVIDLTKVPDKIDDTVRAPIDNPDNNPLIHRLNLKLRLLKKIRADINYAKEMNSKMVQYDEMKKLNAKGIAKMESHFKKHERASVSLMKKLGWIK